MATLATFWRGFFAAEQVQAHAGRPRAAGRAALRALPNEDIYLFVKKIDNTRVVRESDPKAGVSCWKTIGGFGMGALMLVGLLLPSAYSLLAGYQLHALEAEKQRLTREMATLQLEEARLLSPERLQEVAKALHFIDPEPARVEYLNPGADGTVAMNAGQDASAVKGK